MKRKPLEKLSDRLTKLFLHCMKEYNYDYFGMLPNAINRPIENLAKKLSEYCMDMIDEYEPEDIE